MANLSGLAGASKEKIVTKSNNLISMCPFLSQFALIKLESASEIH
jgi:hypothetical protein